MDETVDIDTTLKRLNDQVDQITQSNNSTKLTNSKFMFNFKSPFMFYIAVPVIILIILVLSKPGFIMSEVIIDEKIPENIVNYKKLFISVIILSLIVGIAYFGYSYKKKRKSL